MASRSETTPASKERTLQLRLRPSADLRSWCHVWVRLCDDAAAVDKDALALEAEASALREVTEKLQGHGITAILPLVPDKEFKAQSFGRSYTYLDGFTYPYGANDSTPPSLAESTWYNHLWSAAKPASGVEKSMMPVRNVLELAELDEANVVSPPTNAAYQEAWGNLREARAPCCPRLVLLPALTCWSGSLWRQRTSWTSSSRSKAKYWCTATLG